MKLKPLDENYETRNLIMRPGKVDLLKFKTVQGIEGAKLLCRGRDIAYVIDGDYAYAYISESYFSKLTPYQCLLKKNNEQIIVAEVKVVKFKFPTEKLNVDKKRVVLSKKDQRRVIQERKRTKQIYAAGNSERYFSTPFIAPLATKLTSQYGSRRLFNNMKKTQHLGIDYRSPIGLPIPVANNGKVVLAEHLFYSGNVVIIDHGIGIFSMYGHMSKIKVEVGEMVSQGDILGLAGKTGRVTGPHLHWGVKVGGRWVDGYSLINASHMHFKE